MKKGNRTRRKSYSWKQLLPILCLTILVSCGDPADEKRVEEIRPEDGASVADIIRNPVSADQPQDTINVAKISFDETTIDFGVVAEGQTVEETFTFTNTGKVPLLINAAKSTCGCTIPDWPKHAIAPGEKGKIPVRFNTEGKPNFQSKPVSVFANTYPNKTVVYLKGKVTPSTK